jgi:hypothetical protein
MKLPIATAAILAALTATAANSETVSIRFDGFCNGLDISISKSQPLVHSVENGCAAGSGGGVGVLGAIDGYPDKQYAIGENYDDGAGHYVGEEFWIVSAPLVTGGTYQGWKHRTDGRLKMFGSGTYSVVSAPFKSEGKRLVAP